MQRQVLEILDKAPPGYFGPKLKQHLPEVRRRIAKLAERIDDLGRLDEASGEVFVDESSLRKLLREASPRSEDAVIERLRQFPDNKLIRGNRLKPIPWETLVERMERKAVSKEPEANLRVSPYSSLEEVRLEVQRQSPEIPNAAFEGETLHHQFRTVLDAPGALSKEPEVTGRAASPWDCMVRKLGWFAATMVVVLAAIVAVVILAVAIAAPAVAPLTAAWWPLFWPTFWGLAPTGMFWGNVVATLILVIACVVNPAG
jgi:hypothetical protein